VILAPMEGVTDAPMRAVQGEIGAFSYAVSEFLRISHSVPPRHVFYRHVPELRSGSQTLTGLPVQVQLLGGDPGRMAESAARALECGAAAIDLNFGCPAKTVNRHDGGAALLKHPLRIRNIVREVRAALPEHVPVSAKLRLGWDSIDSIDENAAMAAEGGASWITIHGRTRRAGYAPPIFWRPIGRVREALGIPVVANGDIWSIEDFRRCRDETGCIHVMLGRGALANPGLSHAVAADLGIVIRNPRSLDERTTNNWLPRLRRLAYWSHEFGDAVDERIVRRMKQWLKLAANRGACPEFDNIKRATDVDEVFALLQYAGSSTVSRQTQIH